MIKRVVYCCSFLVAITSSSAQTIHLEFPYFKGKIYAFSIFQGDKAIVLKNDTVPKDGKVKLVLPESYKGYKGMATWYLTNSKTGGGLNLIINNENFSVTCLDSFPTAANIVYKNTKEQEAVVHFSEVQQNVFQKHDALIGVLRTYSTTHPLYVAFKNEYDTIVNQYSRYYAGLSESKTYAAKFIQIENLTKGIGSLLTQDEITKAINANSVIVNTLDFKDLYTSHHWGEIIKSWVQLEVNVVNNDTLFKQDIIRILNRIPNRNSYTDFVSSLTKELTKIGKDALLECIIPEIKNCNKLLNYDGVLNMYRQDLTGVVPDLIITNHIGTPEENKTSTSVLKMSKLTTNYTVLLFYQSGCGHCDDAIKALKENYSYLQSNDFRIISLAADKEYAVFLNTSFSIPWKDKYCDSMGFQSNNFKNYGIVGTPTIFVLNKNGEIQIKVPTVEALLNWMKKK